MIDPAAREWPYQQVAAALREAITTGRIGPKLPSIATLAEEHETAPGTVQRALTVLKEEGLVEGLPGRGVFVVQR